MEKVNKTFNDCFKQFIFNPRGDSPDHPFASAECMVINNVLAHIIHLKLMFDYSIAFPQLLVPYDKKDVLENIKSHKIHSVPLIDNSININCHNFIDTLSKFDIGGDSNGFVSRPFQFLTVVILEYYDALKKDGFFKFIDTLELKDTECSIFLQMVKKCKDFLDLNLYQYIEHVGTESRLL